MPKLPRALAIWVQRNHDAGAMAGLRLRIWPLLMNRFFQFVRDATDWKANRIAEIEEELTWYTIKPGYFQPHPSLSLPSRFN